MTCTSFVSPFGKKALAKLLNVNVDENVGSACKNLTRPVEKKSVLLSPVMYLKLKKKMT